MVVKPRTYDENMIDSLRKSFLIHSYLYYFMDKTVITDNLFDARAKHLARLQKQYPEFEGIYQSYFANFDPATGHDIPVDEWIVMEAKARLNSCS